MAVKRVMSQRETVLMSQLMTQHIRVLPDAGTPADPVCEYTGDWDDEKIAKAIAPDLNANHAYGLRKNCFGKLFLKPGDDNAALLRRIADLEAKYIEASKFWNEIAIKHDKLCMAITIGRVGVDAKHLVIDPKNPAINIGDANGKTIEGAAK